jgi:hypothetical protein
MDRQDAHPMMRFLFSRQPIFEWLTTYSNEIQKAVEAVSNDVLMRDPVEEITQRLVATYTLVVPEFLGDPYLRDEISEVKIDLRHRGPGRVLPFELPGGASVSGFHVEAASRFAGKAELLDCRPSRHTLNFPQGDIKGNEVIVILERPLAGLNQDQIKNEISEALTHIGQYVSWLAADITGFNARLPETVRRLLEDRIRRVQTRNDLQAYLGMEIAKRKDPDPSLAIEIPRRQPVAVERRAASQPTREEPYLRDETFVEIVSFIGSIRRLIERYPGTFAGMSEPVLRDILLLILNNQFGPATGESFSRGGKTDIFIPTPGGPVFIAECKIWAGKKAFSKAIDQMLGYLTWRETKAALITFVRQKNISDVGRQAVAALQEHALFVRPGVEIADNPVSILHHEGDPEQLVRVAVILVAITQPEEATSEAGEEAPE